jgi:hypothetical protein
MPALLAAFGRAPSRRPSPQAVPGSAFNLRMESPVPGRAAALFFQTGAVSDRPIPSLGDTR